VNISYTSSFPFQFIGNLKKLVHFDASTNNINWIAPETGSCCCLTDLTLSCNEIQVSVVEILFIFTGSCLLGYDTVSLGRCVGLLDCWIREDEGSVILRNVSITASHSRRPESSAAPLPEPQISHTFLYYESLLGI
jgi:hypothetical protein